MWSYYGSKTTIVKHYPKPAHNLIVEPFAGSAKYALEYFENDVLILDKNPEIIDIWKYLQVASEGDIKNLPSLPRGARINRDNFDCAGQFMLMRYLIVQGSFRGNNIVSKWGALRFENNKRNVLKHLHKIKHWNILHGSYEDLPNGVATWFIDPPYFIGGHKYKMSNRHIDYQKLAIWSKQREGQVIVCENHHAEWLPFQPLVNHYGSKGIQKEMIYLQ